MHKRLKRLRFDLRRGQTTLADQGQPCVDSSVKPWSEVPKPPSFPLIGNGHLLFKRKKTDLDEVHRNLKETDIDESV